MFLPMAHQTMIKKLHESGGGSIRAALHADRIKIRIARTGIESSQRLGRHRWVIERTVSWLMNYRRLVRRYERLADHFQAFTDIASILICYQHLTK
jgi:transposase